MRVLNLIAANGKFVCAEGGGGYTGNGSFIANRTAALEWEKFTEESFEDGVSLKTYNGNYITAELDGSISTNRIIKGSWEKWFPVDNGYKSVHGNFMGLSLSDNIRCDSGTQGAPQTFQVINLTPVGNLPQLHISGRYFFDEFGKRTFIKGTTDFMLYKWTLEGQDITSILEQRKAHGCNAVRVIGMVSWFDYTPQKYGQRYYDEIPAFLDLIGSKGLYVYFTVFADTQIVMPGLGPQLDHFNKVVSQLKTKKNSFGELVNEPYAHENATANPLAFSRPTGIAFSSGSYAETWSGGPTGQVTPPPYWDFHDFHTPRRDTARVADQCMVTNPNYKNKGQAILSGEPDKFGGPNQYNSKIYLTDADESRKMEKTAEGTAGGYFYHTSAGNYSVLWNDIERHCCPFNMEN